MQLTNATFELGTVAMTAGVVERLTQYHDGDGERARWQIAAMIVSHASGDWGDVDSEDAGENDEARDCGRRILSAYAIDTEGERKGWGDNAVWVITEADRSVTTVLLPDEY